MTSLTRQLLGSEELLVDEQVQSPLFKLPPELRETIWQLTVASYDNLDRPYEINSHYCRPGYTHAQKIDTALLRTCRKIYLEAYHLPLSCNTIAFWAYRGPKGEPDVRRNLGEYFAHAVGLLLTWYAWIKFRN